MMFSAIIYPRGLRSTMWSKITRLQWCFLGNNIIDIIFLQHKTGLLHYWPSHCTVIFIITGNSLVQAQIKFTNKYSRLLELKGGGSNGTITVFSDILDHSILLIHQSKYRVIPFCYYISVNTFFFWPLCCLSFDLRILITLSVSTNSSSYNVNQAQKREGKDKEIVLKYKHVNRRTDNTMARRKRTNNDPQNIHIKLKIE
jgi:hypothetical protein